MAGLTLLSAVSWKLDTNQAKENRYFGFLVLGDLEGISQTVVVT